MDGTSTPQDIPGSRRSSVDESESRRSSIDSTDSMRQGSVDAVTEQRQKAQNFRRAKGTGQLDLPLEFKGFRSRLAMISCLLHGGLGRVCNRYQLAHLPALLLVMCLQLAGFA